MNGGATIGTTSYGFRYLLMDAAHAPPLASLVRQTRQAGLDALQVCENARPLVVSPTEWRSVIQAATDMRVALHLGCMTLDMDTLSRYLERTAMIPGASALRVVLEDESGDDPSLDRVERFLADATVQASKARLTLVVENHFHIPCRVLADMARAYPAEVMAFCVDSANSLRNWESAAQVFDLLGDRAAFYHLKDYRIRGSNVGFEVMGAPLGEGSLDLDACLDRMYARHARPLVFLENWVPATGDRLADIAADADWLRRSLAGCRRALAARAVERHPATHTTSS
jgi:sugar phosphate isomerase/epimerase